MMDLSASCFVNFDYYSPSETFVVLTAGNFWAQ